MLLALRSEKRKKTRENNATQRKPKSGMNLSFQGFGPRSKIPFEPFKGWPGWPGFSEVVQEADLSGMGLEKAPSALRAFPGGVANGQMGTGGQ